MRQEAKGVQHLQPKGDIVGGYKYRNHAVKFYFKLVRYILGIGLGIYSSLGECEKGCYDGVDIMMLGVPVVGPVQYWSECPLAHSTIAGYRVHGLGKRGTVRRGNLWNFPWSSSSCGLQ